MSAVTGWPPRIGLDLYPTRTTWTEMRAVARAADAARYDSLWTWDHLYAADDPAIDILEGWTTVAAWAAITEHPSVGLLVGANTFRHPGLVAKMAVTLDHASGGRGVLGLGAGWRPREHHDHGIAFGSSAGERLAWLEASIALIRGLLRGEAVTSGPDDRYAMHEAEQRPLPVGGPGRLPILVGGGGERRTLRIVARHADIWHHRGSVEYLARKLEILHRHCATEGRDPAAIELAFGPHVIVRDEPAEARTVLARTLATHGVHAGPDLDDAWLGPPEHLAERWRPYLELGFDHLIVSVASPYDRETVERLADVRALVSPSREAGHGRND